MSLSWDRGAALAVKGAYKQGDRVRMPCPVHGGTDALTIGPGTKKAVVWHCHAGCDYRDVGEELEKMGIIKREARPNAERGEAEKKRRTLDWIKRKWDAASWKEGPFGYYFKERGIPLYVGREDGAVGHVLRFHPDGEMLAKVTDSDGKMIGLHRTIFHSGGRKERKAHGTLKGGSIKLSTPNPGNKIAIAEGIETALAYHALFPEVGPVWSLISAGGIQGFEPPPSVNKVIVAADFDGAGITAFERLRKRLSGIRVEIHLPPEYGMDWNDALLEIP